MIDSSRVLSNRKIAKGKEVTEENLGFPLFVHRPASRCEAEG